LFEPPFTNREIALKKKGFTRIHPDSPEKWFKIFYDLISDKTSTFNVTDCRRCRHTVKENKPEFSAEELPLSGEVL